MRSLSRFAFALLLCASGATWAQGWTVPAGGALHVGNGQIGLSGGDVAIAGVFTVGAGQVLGVDDFAAAAGASIALGSGLLALTGDWSNAGTLDAGTSTVRMRDPGPESRILGTTRFSTLSLVTATGKTWRLEAGRTQTVSAALEIIGNGAPIGIASTGAGQTAYLALEPGGTQSIANVAVSDVNGTGQLLAPGQTNQGGSGNDAGWFGGGGPGPGVTDSVVIPATDFTSLFALALLALATAFISLRHGAFDKQG